MKTLILTLICFIIGAILSGYAAFYPNNAFCVSFFSGMFAVCVMCACVNIHLIYDEIKEK